VSRSKRSSTPGSQAAGYCRLGLLRGHRHSIGNREMESLEDKVAIVTGESSGIGVVVAELNKKKMIGFLLCLGAMVVVAAGWSLVRSSGETATDNAYLQPKRRNNDRKI